MPELTCRRVGGRKILGLRGVGQQDNRSTNLRINMLIMISAHAPSE